MMSSFLGTQSLGSCSSLSGTRLCGQAQTPKVSSWDCWQPDASMVELYTILR